MEGQDETKSCEPMELGQRDFSRPWTLSDVILVAEGEKFHVHRSTLAMWSPVFEKMFTSDFKEKQLDEVPLPEKKASEIREMLLVMYVKTKPVTEDNVFFLLDLAQEYQMDQLRHLCEECLIGKTTKAKAIPFLVLAQWYGLYRLAEECITHGANLSLQEIQNHDNCSRLNPTFRQRLAERRVRILESLISQTKNHLNETATKVCNYSRTFFPYALQPVQPRVRKLLPQPAQPSAVDRALEWLKQNKASSKPDYLCNHDNLHDVFEKLCCLYFGLHQNQ